MGAARSRSRETALSASSPAQRLRRSHSFSRPPGTSRYLHLHRSRNHLPRLEIPSRRLHPQIPKPRTHAAVARFLRSPFSRRFRRYPACARQTHGVGSMWRDAMHKSHIKSAALFALASIYLSAGCGSGQGGSRDQPAENSPAHSTPEIKARPLTNRSFERTPECLARGRYLVNGIGECFACHGPFESNTPGWPPVRGKEGSGLENFSSETPGVVAANLTPDRETGIGNWTDDMLARAIREGVGHDGRLLHPTVMPYEFYRSMSDEDLASVIVYLRSIPPIRNALPVSRTSQNIVVPYAIPIYAPVPRPDLSAPVKRGAYLVQIGACQWCHTLRDANRKPLPGLEFAGGDLIIEPDYQVTSANLSPDPSGISYYE